MNSVQALQEWNLEHLGVDEANQLLDDFARNYPAKRNEITKLRQMLSTAR